MTQRSQPIQNRRGRFLTSVETIDDQLEEERSRGRPQASRVHNKIQRARAQAGKGSRLGIRALLPHLGTTSPVRPYPQGPADKRLARRCMAKVSYIKNRKPGQWGAHGKYLEREGAQREGEKGHGFTADAEEVSIPRTLNTWQVEDDHALFKVILAPEDPLGPEGLRYFTRKFNEKMQWVLDKDYEWIAADHYNTSHPHVHLLIRGKDNLQLAPDLIRRGMREAASEVLTEQLGYRSEQDLIRSKEQELDVRRFTRLDRAIQGKAQSHESGYWLVDEYPDDLTEKGIRERRLRVARLEHLVKIGVADKIGPNTWRLEPGWDRALKELQILQTRTKMVAQARALMTEPRCVPQVTRLAPGDRLVGRVLGTGLDDENGRTYVLLEGVDNRAHIVYQTASMERAREKQDLQLRNLVALTGLDRGVAVKDYGLVIPDQGFRSVKIPDAALDDEMAHEDRHGIRDTLDPKTGFAAVWHQEVRARRERERRKKEQERKAERARKAEKQSRTRKPGSEIE